LTFDEWMEKLDGHISLLTGGLTCKDFQHVVSPKDLSEWWKSHFIMRSVAVEVLRRDGWGAWLDLDSHYDMEWRNA
jgi:hypothetical protein